MKSKCIEGSTGARLRVGALLAVACLTAGAAADPMGASRFSAQPPAAGLLARAELCGAGSGRLVVSLSGGRPWSAALLSLESGNGRVLQAIQLDAQGGYRRELPAPRTRSALRLSFRARGADSGPSASPQASNAVSVPALPQAGGAGVHSGVAVICEIMKNPVAVSDSVGEWFEVYNAGDMALDLEGWSISDSGSNFHVISVGGTGLIVQPGARLVLGNNDDPNVNGGVLVDYRYSSFSLANSADDVFLTTPGGVLADAVQYDASGLWPNTAGASLSLSALAHDPLANDDPAAWCDAQTPVAPGSSDLGTPGQRNAICP